MFYLPMIPCCLGEHEERKLIPLAPSSDDTLKHQDIKSSILFSKCTPHQLKRDILSSLAMSEMSNTERYLGIPAFWGKSKTQVLEFIKNRVKTKTQAWKQNLLSQAGREVMIKSVLNVISAYAMAIIKFPKSLCFQLNRIASSFRWGRKAEDKKFCWVSWQRASYPKYMGGMGFRDFEKFNLACLAKQGWHLLTDPDSQWARFIKAEMVRRQALFPGDSEFQQLLHVFRLLGTPTEKQWPGVTSLRDWHVYPQWEPQNLARAVPSLGPEGVDLLSKMLKYDPAERISAKVAMDHPYFDNLDKSQF
ncbi:uncharacterized protein LOC110667708 isoform X2 [Hevea brasiliensis]|uniref:uncharacterized protein LOC110667708 isoform X2 n=1 Tax=Hevea brasiliensis TaxID=3981 RepID=UPI0025E7BB61|nr:uncharacterized protein LOC110667708 isoform X2 [Hevea brasiliensis]